MIPSITAYAKTNAGKLTVLELTNYSSYEQAIADVRSHLGVSRALCSIDGDKSPLTFQLRRAA